MASVRWSTNALKSLDALDPLVRGRVLSKVTWLGENFDSIALEKLHGELKTVYKLRVGDYRAIYSIHGNVITIEAVGHRRNIYR